MHRFHVLTLVSMLLAASAAPPASAAQAPKQAAPKAAAPAAKAPAQPGVSKPVATPMPPQAPPGVTPPAGYLIGADDVLIIVFWQEKDMSGEVVVRPDGKISLPLVNDVVAAGLTPEQLRANLEEAASQFVQQPSATVVVKQINSRKMFITGMVSKPGAYSLTAPTTVLQLIAMAGGLLEYADREHVIILRGQTSFRFNYKDVAQQKKLGQNIELKAGDTVLVP